MDHYKLAKICQEASTLCSHSKNDVEILVKCYDTHCVVAIRGTEARDLWTQQENFKWKDLFKWRRWKAWAGGVTDVVRDLMAWPKYSKDIGGYFHAGFLSGAEDVLDFILDGHLFDPETTPLIITGHSLGGGVALPLSLLLKKHGVKVLSCVVFGCPRSVLKRSRHVFTGSHLTSYRFKDDFVPTVPKKGWGYIHPVAPIQLGDCGQRAPNWDDHSLENYIEALKPLGE